MAQPLWKIVEQFLIKLNMHLPYGLPTPLLGIYAREMETYVHTKTCPQMFTTALLTMSPNRNQLKCPSVGEWLKKLWYIHECITLQYEKALCNKKEQTIHTHNLGGSEGRYT